MTIRDNIIHNANNQPQAWQALWHSCGMPQPASDFKIELDKMEKDKVIGIKRISGHKYYYKKQ